MINKHIKQSFSMCKLVVSLYVKFDIEQNGESCWQSCFPWIIRTCIFSINLSKVIIIFRFI